MTQSLRSRVIRLAHANLNLRGHLLPLLKTATGLSDDVLDFFDEPSGPVNNLPELTDPTSLARSSIMRDIGASGVNAHLPLQTYVKPGSTSGVLHDLIWYWRSKGWAIITEAPSEAKAKSIGLKVQKNLIAPSKLESSDPYVHTLPLFVIYAEGQWVRLNPMEKVKRVPTGPSLSELKHKITRQGEDFFGSKSIRITGSDGSYRIRITPTIANLKKLFRPAQVSAETLEGLLAKLNQAIERVKELTA